MTARTAMTTAWTIRREAAARLSVTVGTVDMAECLRMAWTQIKTHRTDYTEYKSATGRTVKAYIKTETENIADHNYKTRCYEFVLEVEGLGRINVYNLKDGMFYEGFPREVNGKTVKVMVPASPEAAAIYETYRAEGKRRLDLSLRREAEYRAGYNRIVRAMHG